MYRNIKYPTIHIDINIFTITTPISYRRWILRYYDDSNCENTKYPTIQYKYFYSNDTTSIQATNYLQISLMISI